MSLLHRTGETSFQDRIDFVVIGAMKSGTTSIETNLRHSPDFAFVPNRRNTRPPLFGADRDPAYVAMVDRYLAGMADSAARIGHVKGDYHADPTVMDDLIARPNLKLVLTYRDPVSRLYSHYNHHLKQGYTRQDFARWIDSSQGQKAIALSAFGKCLEAIADRLSPERFAIMAMEDTSTPDGIAALSAFLQGTTPARQPRMAHATVMPRHVTLNYAARQAIDGILTRGSGLNKRANDVRNRFLLTKRKPQTLDAQTRATLDDRFAEDFATFRRRATPFLLGREAV